jgi:hypothetical protein
VPIVADAYSRDDVAKYAPWLTHSIELPTPPTAAPDIATTYLGHDAPPAPPPLPPPSFSSSNDDDDDDDATTTTKIDDATKKLAT